MSEARQRLQAVLQDLGILAKKSLGQNFLISDVIIERIIRQVEIFSPDRLIEVGPGPGALTDYLLKMEKPLTVIELDHVMASYWRQKGLDVIEEDALRMDWSKLYGAGNTVLVSNLPYQISSSLVIERSLEDDGVKSMVLMFQKEVAQRIRATAQSEHYGLLSVIAQAFWKTEVVTEAGPRDFDPPPRVASRVLSFSRHVSPVRSRKAYLSFVKMAFAQRRKLLKKNLAGLLGQKKITEDQLIAILHELGFPATARAEELSPVQFIELYKKLGLDT